MKYTLLACSLVSFLAATGCASTDASDDDSGNPEEDAAVTHDTGKPDISAPDANQCEQLTCAGDLDCQSVCPPVENGTNCCDTSTEHCYAYASTSCPEPVVDAGFD